MRKLFWQINSTVDGFMEGPTGELNHTAQVADKDFERYASAMLQDIDGFIVGRKTYELFVSHWPNASGPDADRLNHLPKLVFSRTLRAVAWSQARLASGDPVAETSTWKAMPGRDLALFGSANLAATLLQGGLIDEVRLFVTPFLLGRGHPTFSELPVHVNLKLVSATTWQSGTVALIYRKA